MQELGFTREQSEGFAKIQSEAMKAFVASRDLATKADLMETEVRILRWMVGGFIAQTALLVAVLSFMR